jgi:putative phosphoesterase
LQDGKYLIVEGVLQIAVIADTHDRYPADLPRRLAGADEIWHLGDVCAREVLAAFEKQGRPLHVVLGNNEDHAGWPLSLGLEREGWRFFLVHIPPRQAPVGVQVVLHGHTHVPRDDTDAQGVRWLNPGCITRPNRGAPASFAWLTIERGRPLGWKLIQL